MVLRANSAARRYSVAMVLGAFGAAILLVACSSKTESSPTPTQPPATNTAAPLATATPSPTPLPTVEPPDLKLRLVNVVSGANSELPVGFGGSRAWSADSTRIAVADDFGVSVGPLTGQSFVRVWFAVCRAVQWATAGDMLAAACANGLVVLDSKGNVIAHDQTLIGDWVRSIPWIAWAPDGKAVAYGSSNANVNVMKLDGSRQVIPGTFADGQWLADGRLATIEQITYRDAATIRILDPAKGYAVVSTAVTRPAANGLAVDFGGRHAAYTVLGEASGQGGPRILPSTLVVLRISDGREFATLPAYAAYGSIDFAPDGNTFLLETDYCGAGWSLGVGGVDGSVRSIARGSFMVTKFSPDGSQVGFTRGTELWVVPSDGSAPARRLAEGVHGPAGFEWSPDGKWISVPPFFGGFDQCP